MSDFIMCKDFECPARANCVRYIGEKEPNQKYYKTARTHPREEQEAFLHSSVNIGECYYMVALNRVLNFSEKLRLKMRDTNYEQRRKGKEQGYWGNRE